MFTSVKSNKRAALLPTMLLVSMGVAPLRADANEEWLSDIGLAPAKPKAKVAAKTASDTKAKATPKATAKKLKEAGESEIKTKNYDLAIRLLEESMALVPDIHTRSALAFAQEAQLESMSTSDARLFNNCVKHWFFIFEHAEFVEERDGAAKHLKSLTGKQPPANAKPETYLPAVLAVEDELPQVSPEEPPGLVP